MDNRSRPEEYEAETDGAPFFEAPLGELCLAAAIAACVATLFALVSAVMEVFHG